MTFEPLGQRGELLSRAKLFDDLAGCHRDTATKCDGAGLPVKYGEYERGKADAYNVCASVFRHLASTNL